VRGCLDRIQKSLNLAVAADMLKRRLKQAGLAGSLFAPLVPGDWDHELLENDGTLKAAQRIARHADSQTTKLHETAADRGFCSTFGADSLLTAFGEQPPPGARQTDPDAYTQGHY
jgi:hypothetical protein